jgi:heme-degrading monooxygenase HmoA
MFASVTRLRVRSLRFLPAFLWYTFGAQRQVRRAPGFAGGRLLVDTRRTYWTLTVWATEKDMKKFRGSGAHARVMPLLANWCDEAAYAHWAPASEQVPTWEEAYERLLADAHLSRVMHPTDDRNGRKFPRPRLKPLIGQDIRPAA